MPPIIKYLAITSVLAFLSACASQSQVLISKESFLAAQQCLLQQQQQQQQLLNQQQQFSQSLNKLTALLEKPLSVNGAVVKLSNDAKVCTANPELIKQKAGEPVHDNKQIVGSVEDVRLPELNLTLLGRIDTGATTASIDAQDIQVFERDGENWVKFKIKNPTADDYIEFERKLVRRVLINQSNSDSPERRPVIELQVTIGKVSQRAEFNLTDRSHLDYQVLIGRNILRDMMIVDVSKKHLAPLHIKE